MATVSIKENLEPIFGGLTVTGGGWTVTFPWAPWEDRWDQGGPFSSVEDITKVFQISDIGAGARRQTDFMRVHYFHENPPRDINAAEFRDALVRAFLDLINANQHSLDPAYHVDLVDVDFDEVRVDDPEDEGPVVVGHDVSFVLSAFRVELT